MQRGIMFPIWLLFEFLLFLKLVSLYGFLKIFAFYTLPSFLGFFILAYFPKAFMGSLQKSMNMQEKPSSKILHSLFIIFSALFFIIPSVSTRIIGLTLFLPISRHLFVAILIWQWYKLAGKFFGKFQKFNFGSNGFSVYTGFFSSTGFKDRTINPEPNDSVENSTYINEREVIDITPKTLNSKTTKMDEDQ
jgi:UPF0716 family protein affecting phage T7 exclusion